MAFRLHWPTEFKTINQGFGENPQIYNVFGLPGHEGIDFGVPNGSKVFACADGQVTLVKLDGDSDRMLNPYGNQLRISHVVAEGTFISIYAHLQDVSVSLGQKVKVGDLVGHSNNTGNSTGPHLHLTLKRVGATAARQTIYPRDIIDPTPFLDPFGTKLPSTRSTPPVVVTPPANPVTPGAGSTGSGSSGPGSTGSGTPVTTPTPVDLLRFISDVNIPDNTLMAPGQQFTKTWKIQNSGTTAWGAGYTLAYFGDERLSVPDVVPLPSAAPGQIVNASVILVAPFTPGTYRCTLKAKNPQGQFFGVVVFTVIKVQG